MEPTGKSLSLESLKFEGYQSYVDAAVASLRAEFLEKAAEIRCAETESDKLLTKNLNAIQSKMTHELEDFLMTTVTITQSGADKLRKHSEEARAQATDLVESAREAQRKCSADLLERMLEGVAKKFDDELEGHQSKMSQRFFEAKECLNDKMAEMRQAKELELRDKYALNRNLVSDHNRAVAEKAAAEVKAEAERQAELWKPLQEEHASLKRRYELLEFKLRNAEGAQAAAKKRLEFYEPPFLNGPKEDVPEDSQWGFLDDALLSTLVEVGIRRGNLSASSLVSQATFARRQFGHDGTHQDSGRFPNIHRRPSHLDLDSDNGKKPTKHHGHGPIIRKEGSTMVVITIIMGVVTVRVQSQVPYRVQKGAVKTARSQGPSVRLIPLVARVMVADPVEAASKRASTIGSGSSGSYDNDSSVTSLSGSDHHHHSGSHHDDHHDHRRSSVGLHRRTSHRQSMSHGGGGSHASHVVVDSGGFEATFGVGSGGLLITSGTVNMTKEMLLLKGTICALKTKCEELRTETDKNKGTLYELETQTLPLLKAQLSVESKRSVALTQKVSELTSENKQHKRLLNEQEILLKEMTKRETLLRDSLEGSMGSKALEAALASDDLSKRRSSRRSSSQSVTPALTPTGRLTPTNRLSIREESIQEAKSSLTRRSSSFIANRNNKLATVTLSLESEEQSVESEPRIDSLASSLDITSQATAALELPDTPNCPTKEDEINQVKKMWEKQNHKKRQEELQETSDDGSSVGSDFIHENSADFSNEIQPVPFSSSTSSTSMTSSNHSTAHSAGMSSLFNNSYTMNNHTTTDENKNKNMSSGDQKQLSVGTLVVTRTKSSEKMGGSDSLLHIEEQDDEMEPDSAGLLKNVDADGNIISKQPIYSSHDKQPESNKQTGPKKVDRTLDAGLDYKGSSSEVGDSSEYRGAADLSVDRSGVHVSYLEELHQHERSELARQMATLALASQEKDMLLKSLTDALKNQKQMSARLEAQLSQTTQRQWHHVPDPNHVSTNQNRPNNGARVVGIVKQLQPELELPTSTLPSYPNLQTEKKQKEITRKQQKSGNDAPPVIKGNKSENYEDNLRVAVDSIELGDSTLASQLNDSVVEGGPTREVMKRSFLMQKNGGIGDSTGTQMETNSNNGRTGRGIMTKSSPPLLMAAARTHSPTRNPVGFTDGVPVGRGARGPRGSRLGNRNAVTISYESKLF